MTETNAESTATENSSGNTSEAQKDSSRSRQEGTTMRPPSSIQIDLHVRIDGISVPEGGLVVMNRAVDEGGGDQKPPGHARDSDFESNA